MGKFTTIPLNTFEGLQMDAGVLLKNFDPANPVPPADEDIICATTGGIQVSCVPSFSDLGEDIDNVPAAMKELKHLDSWECKFAFTSLGTTAESIRLALGAADINAETGAIVPRRDLLQSDFTDIWWVGDRADGGLVACKLKNALSTSGFSLQTTKNGKGQVSVELTGHVALADQNSMPMELYSADPTETLYSVTQNLTNVTSDFTPTTIAEKAPLVAHLTADAGYEIDAVTVYMGGVNISATAYAEGTVTIGSVTGNVQITASATATGETHSVTQNLTNVTSSFTGNSVADGASFTATLTADDTYTLGTVEVTMGGDDITSTAYDDGVVTISAVTGDIVITAEAEA
jgi:hypothetical protein